MTPILLAAALKLELPGHTVRLVDGGTIEIAGERYGARDDLIGFADSFAAVGEGVGDEAPGGMISFIPPGDAPALSLNSPANQNARLRIMIAEVDSATGLVVGAVMQLVDWMVDTSEIVIDEGKRTVEFGFVSGGDRLFQINRGNSLSPNFHRGVHPGEAGLDNASGVELTVPWGAAAQPRGTATAPSGSGGGVSGGSTGRMLVA